jgi:hypothetical protein
MSDHLTCRHPDRAVPKLMCGYPLPCPHHTVIIHADKRPPTVEIPVDSDALKSPVREAALRAAGYKHHPGMCLRVVTPCISDEAHEEMLRLQTETSRP